MPAVWIHLVSGDSSRQVPEQKIKHLVYQKFIGNVYFFSSTQNQYIEFCKAKKKLFNWKKCKIKTLPNKCSVYQNNLYGTQLIRNELETLNMSHLVVSECLTKKIEGGKPILKLLVLNNYSVKILIESVSIILNTESFKNIYLSISSTSFPWDKRFSSFRLL